MTEILDHTPHAVSCGFVTKSVVRNGSFQLYKCSGLVEMWSPSGDVGTIANHDNDSMKRVTIYLFL